MQKHSKILSKLDVAAQLVYNTHANKVLDEFYSEEEEKQPIRKNNQQKTAAPTSLKTTHRKI